MSFQFQVCCLNVSSPFGYSFFRKPLTKLSFFSCKLPIINKVNAPFESIMNPQKYIFLSKTSCLTQSISIAYQITTVYTMIFTSIFLYLTLNFTGDQHPELLLSAGTNKDVSVLLLYKCLLFHSLLSNEFECLPQET